MTTRTANLFNEMTFYPAFIKDMLRAKKEVIVYSPFISRYRADFFRKTLIKLRKRNINVFVFTRAIDEHEQAVRDEIDSTLSDYEKLGVNVIRINGLMHEKLAIIDRKILWEGSLNILSQRASKEIMRRIFGEEHATQCLSYMGTSEKLTKVSEKGQKINLNSAIESLFLAFKWSLFAVFQVMIVLLKGILAAFKIVDVILR